MKMIHISAAVALLLICRPGMAADVNFKADADTGWPVASIKEADLTIKLCPAAGLNVFSIQYKGTEMLKTPKSLRELRGFMYGVPVLYPMPNRVRAGRFTFEGQKFSFTPNKDGNFLHGLVHSVAWETANMNIGQPTTLSFTCPFAPGSDQFKLFPLQHDLQLSISVTDHSVRWTYTVDNTKGDKPIPFGFALHPWFLYQGSRKETFLTVPATHLMESEKLLPTGKLLGLADTKLDLRKPRSLDEVVCDDVFFGMKEADPTVIDFRQPRVKVTLKASDEFTHFVLYTPKDQPWFCTENQTCSTDAHNLYDQGLKKESHLQIVPPGKTATGWVEYDFSSY